MPSLVCLDQTLSIYLVKNRVHCTEPNPELAPLEGEFGTSLNQSTKTLQWEKCRYITDIEKALRTLHNIFTKKT